MEKATLYSNHHTKIIGIEAKSRHPLIDRSSLIFCQIRRITVRRLNELAWWLSLTFLHGSKASFSFVPSMKFYIILTFLRRQERDMRCERSNWRKITLHWRSIKHFHPDGVFQIYISLCLLLDTQMMFWFSSINVSLNFDSVVHGIWEILQCYKIKKKLYIF